jgi:hypothetical protein
LACASYSAIHIAETLIKYQTGHFWEFSERALAKLSGTTHQGNSLENVINAINKYGLILDRDWDALTYGDQYNDISWDQYYADIPVPVLKKAYGFTAQMSKLSPSQASKALETGPLWTIIDVGPINHVVMQINQTQYYDSYEIRIKNFQPAQPIISQYKLLLIPKPMTNALLVKKGDEYGYYIPATNEPAMIDKALNFGYPLATLENGTKVDWNNIKPDIVI